MQFTTLLALCGLAGAASLQRVANFGANPAIVVAVHHCQGTASSFYGSTPYARLADQKGFVVVYPESPYQGTCFDVSSRKTLTHDGGGDSNSIANMVKYAIAQYKADAKRVHLVGASSGAMMANVMAATYPELFQTVIAHSGVPAGCFMSASGQVNGWNSSCANGQVRPSQAVWTKMARDMYPGYSGARPRMMIMHGGTDTTLHWNNYEEALKQWRGVLGVADSATRTLQNSPESGYTTTFYGGDGQLTAKVKGVWNPKYGHNIPIIGGDDMAFMGL